MPPLVTFIVPCYNYGRYLPDCLNSILGQRAFDYEIILIDDASTDNTAEVLQSFAGARVRVVRHPTNRGHAETITEGLQEARGALVARIDPDDRYRPDFLSSLVPKLLADSEVGLVYGDAALIDDLGHITAERSDRVHGGKDCRENEFTRLLEENVICAPTVIARREAWLEALPVPRGLAFNDWYFWLMMARRWTFYYVDRVVADYRVHATNLHTQIALDGSEEESVFRLLDSIYSQTELLPELERQKVRVKGRVYGAQYLTLANKYFGLGMNAQARRCYLSAMRYSPAYAFRVDILRRVAATYIARETYAASKALIKAARSVVPGAPEL